MQAQLVATSGTKISRSAVTLLVPTPAFKVTYPTYGSPAQVSGYQGEILSIPISINSVNGYVGTATLTLSGLPLKVSAQDLKVNIQTGVESRANIQIVIDKDAYYGQFALKIMGIGLADDNGYDNITNINLTVNAARILLVGTPSFMAPAQGGFWALSGNRYVNGSWLRTLSRFVNGKRVQNQDLLNSDNVESMLSTANGDVILPSTSRFLKVTTDGAVVSSYVPNLQVQGQFAVDKQDRLWLIQYNGYENRYVLGTLAITGGQESFNEVIDLGSGYGSHQIYSDDSGSNIYLTGYVANSITKIDAITNIHQDIRIPGNIYPSSLAFAADGTIWGAQYSGGIFKINGDGTASIYNTLPAGDQLFFDKLSPNILWVSGGYSNSASVHKINTNTLEDVVIPIGGQVSKLIQNTLGGATAVTSAGTDYYVTLLK